MFHRLRLRAKRGGTISGTVASVRLLLTRGRIPYLLLLALVAPWCALQASRVGVERDNESLVARDAAQDALYDRFRATFGSDEDLLLALRHPQLLTPAGLELVRELTRRVAAMPGVGAVYSLTNAQQIVAGADGAETAPLLPAPFAAASAAAALDRNPDFTGLFISADRETAGLLVEIEDRGGDHDYRTALIHALRQLAAQTTRDGISLHLTGVAAQKADVSEYIEHDKRWLMPLSVAVLAAVLAVFFRRLLGVVLPLAVTGITVAATLAVYGLAGYELNAITALLPPVLMVLSLAVSVHVIQGWIEAPPGDDGVARICAVVRRVRFPCFFCAVTTALGFGSLMTSPMPAVQQFGLFAAIGVLLSFAVGITLVPVGLSFLTPPPSPQAVPHHPWFARVLRWSAEQAMRRPWRVLAVFAALTALALGGLPFVRNNTDLVRFLKSDAPLFRDTMFIDAHLTGANTLDFVVTRRDGAPLTAAADLRRLGALEQAILDRPLVTGVTSMLAAVRQVQRAQSGGEALVLPPDDEASGDVFDLLDAAADQRLLRKLVAADFTAARLNVRIHAVGTAEVSSLAAAIRADGRRLLGDGYQVQPTGAFFRIAEDSNDLVRAQIASFGSAIALVFLAIGVLFRSWRMVLVSVIPNVMPIIWTGGLMGAFGIDLSTGTTMIASAVIGLVVDDTIHYLDGFQRAYRGDPAAAVWETTTGVGTALLMNNVLLVLGFWVGCFGSFKPTIYFSLFSGVTLLTALVCDLLVTPACLTTFGAPVRRAS
jgi:predicted RND superfamily exporter protein